MRIDNGMRRHPWWNLGVMIDGHLQTLTIHVQ